MCTLCYLFLTLSVCQSLLLVGNVLEIRDLGGGLNPAKPLPRSLPNGSLQSGTGQKRQAHVEVGSGLLRRQSNVGQISTPRDTGAVKKSAAEDGECQSDINIGSRRSSYTWRE